MGLIAATVGSDVAQLSASAGQRIICVAWNRSGATSFGVTPDAGSATWTNRIVEATLSGDDSARRSLAVAELAPTGTVSAVTFTAAWNTGDTGAIWLVVEEGAGYDFVTSAVADSGTGTVASLATGSTQTVATGDVLAVAALVSRDGDTGNVTWAFTDVEPDLVGGGAALLDHFGGVGAGGGNAGAAGYLAATGQPEQSYADTVTLPGGGTQTRMLTAALAIWSTAEVVPPTEPTLVAVRGSAQNLTSQTSTAVDLAAGGSVATGNLLVARVALDNAAAGGAAATLTVTDPRSNTWTVVGPANRDPGAANAGTTCYLAFAQVGNAYSDGDDLTFDYNGTSVPAKAIVVEEWMNIDTVTPVAVAATTATGGSATPSIARAPTAADQLFYGALAIEGPSGDTYTQDADTTDGAWASLTSLSTASGTAAANQTIRGTTKLVTGTTEQTWNPAITNRDWAMVALVFAQASTVLTATVNQVTETSAATSTGVAKAKATGQATDAGAARPVTAAQAIAVDQVTESGAAQTVGAAKTRTVGQATDTGAAQPTGVAKSTNVDQVTETGIAQAAAGRKAATVGPAAGSDAAQSLTTGKAQTLGLLDAVDTAQAVTAARGIPVAQAVESADAADVAPTKAAPVGQASSAALARAVAVVGQQQVPVGRVVDTASARPVSQAPLRRLIRHATAVDSARPVSPPGLLLVPVDRVASTDSAQPLAWAPRHRLVGRATDTSAVGGLVSGKARPAGQAAQTDHARVLVAAGPTGVGRAAEADTARPLQPPPSVTVPAGGTAAVYSTTAGVSTRSTTGSARIRSTTAEVSVR